MAAVESALKSGDPLELERLLVGRRIWVVVPSREGSKVTQHVYDCRVLSFGGFYPAGPLNPGDPHSSGGHRTKHLVKLWTDPGGTRVLSVGSIHLKDPGRVSGALRRAADEREAAGNPA